MEASNINSLLEQLDDEIDDLEDSLVNILLPAFSKTSSTLPLLDKAKFYVLVTYAIESILFSYLRLNGVKAREHPVFQELTRVRQYFGKIKAAEEPSDGRPLFSLDKQAAARFIRAGLAGNDGYDSNRAQQLDLRKNLSHPKLETSAKDPENATTNPSSASDSPEPSNVGIGVMETSPPMVVRKSKKRKAAPIHDSVLTPSLSLADSDSELGIGNDKDRKEKKRRKKNRKRGKEESKEPVESQTKIN